MTVGLRPTLWVGMSALSYQLGHELPLVATPHSEADVGLLVVDSAVMQRLLFRLRAAALSQRPVLFVGESGSGRSYLARWLHAASERADRPLVEVSGMSATPMESWLTLAERSRGGTLLCTDLDRLDGYGQRDLIWLFSKLPTMNRPPQVIATAHPSIDASLRSGRFDRALYDRLSVLRLDVPTLRERTDDIPTLCRLLLLTEAVAHGRQVPELSPDALLLLRDYPWPGNVRELANVLLRALLWNSSPTLSAGQLRTYLPHDWPHSDVQLRIGTTLYDAEKRFILASYHALGQNKQLTATQLGITRRTLYQKLRRYEAEASSPKEADSEVIKTGSRREAARDL